MELFCVAVCLSGRTLRIHLRASEACWVKKACCCPEVIQLARKDQPHSVPSSSRITALLFCEDLLVAVGWKAAQWRSRKEFKGGPRRLKSTRDGQTSHCPLVLNFHQPWYFQYSVLPSRLQRPAPAHQARSPVTKWSSAIATKWLPRPASETILHVLLPKLPGHILRSSLSSSLYPTSNLFSGVFIVSSHACCR